MGRAKYDLAGLVGRTHIREAYIDISEHTQQSTAIDLDGYRLLGLIVPTLTGPACHLQFLVSETEAGTYRSLVDNTATPESIAVGTGNVAIGSDYLSSLAGYRWVKIETQIEQGADRTFKWILKG